MCGVVIFFTKSFWTDIALRISLSSVLFGLSLWASLFCFLPFVLHTFPHDVMVLSQLISQTLYKHDPLSHPHFIKPTLNHRPNMFSPRNAAVSA